jgi:hypothetical protein
VTVHLKDVPKDAAERMAGRCPLVAFSLLQHEHKKSVVHFTVQRNTEYDDTVRSKVSKIAPPFRFPVCGLTLGAGSPHTLCGTTTTTSPTCIQPVCSGRFQGRQQRTQIHTVPTTWGHLRGHCLRANPIRLSTLCIVERSGGREWWVSVLGSCSLPCFTN